MLLRQLEYIVAVDNERSFTKAADTCCVTQPTLSQQIRVLEEHLNVEIFDRRRTPVEPTQRGRLIIEKARLVVSQARQLERIARELAG